MKDRWRRWEGKLAASSPNETDPAVVDDEMVASPWKKLLRRLRRIFVWNWTTDLAFGVFVVICAIWWIQATIKFDAEPSHSSEEPRASAWFFQPEQHQTKTR